MKHSGCPISRLVYLRSPALCIYSAPFQILFNFYGMPIMMLRDLTRAFVDVRREMGNVVASRR